MKWGRSNDLIKEADATVGQRREGKGGLGSFFRRGRWRSEVGRGSGFEDDSEAHRVRRGSPPDGWVRFVADVVVAIGFVLSRRVSPKVGSFFRSGCGLSTSLRETDRVIGFILSNARAGKQSGFPSEFPREFHWEIDLETVLEKGFAAISLDEIAGRSVLRWLSDGPQRAPRIVTQRLDSAGQPGLVGSSRCVRARSGGLP